MFHGWRGLDGTAAVCSVTGLNQHQREPVQRTIYTLSNRAVAARQDLTRKSTYLSANNLHWGPPPSSLIVILVLEALGLMTSYTPIPNFVPCHVCCAVDFPWRRYVTNLKPTAVEK